MRTVAAVVALVLCVHAGLWALFQRQQAAANITAPLASISYSPFARSQHPDRGDRPTPEQIRADLKLLSPYTHAIRTYSSTGGGELVPAIAAEFGLKVTLGIWIDKNEARNEREIQSAIALARRYRNVNAIVVGNETTLRAEKTVDELIKIIQRVKRRARCRSPPAKSGRSGSTIRSSPPRSTSSPPTSCPIGKASRPASVDQTIDAYDKLRQSYPGKRIVIAEFGWPSAGYNMHDADPGRIEQATVLRDFIARAEAYGIDYNIIEAFDQPWKTNEGSVGIYWGMFDAARTRQVRLDRADQRSRLLEDRRARGRCSGCCCRCRSWRAAAPPSAKRVTLAVAANVVGAWFATVFAFWKTTLFRARRGLRARPRHRAADPAGR